MVIIRLVAALFLFAACTIQHRNSVCPRVPWSSCERTLAAIEAWPDGDSNLAPWAIYVAIPSDLADQDFDRIHRAIRARGYGAQHSEPSMLDPTTELTARLALADPVEQDFGVSADVAQLLWSHSIPFLFGSGNSQTVFLPRRCIAAARRILKDAVPSETRWHQ